jgi:hypothetical protein
MVSGKNIPSSLELANINVTSSTDVMASGDSKPFASQIEDVKRASLAGVTALPEMPSSPISAEKEDTDYDAPPDGGLFAWMQVFGGWILILNSR